MPILLSLVRNELFATGNVRIWTFLFFNQNKLFGLFHQKSESLTVIGKKYFANFIFLASKFLK